MAKRPETPSEPIVFRGILSMKPIPISNLTRRAAGIVYVADATKNGSGEDARVRISFSLIDNYLTCPQRYFLREILRLPEPKPSRMIMGSAVHRVLERNYTHKLTAKVDLSEQEASREFREYFDHLTESEDIDWAGEDPGRLREAGLKIVKRYLSGLGAFLVPAEDGVERWLERQLGEHLVVGKLDLVLRQGTVVDFKTVSYPWNDDMIHMSLQPTVYSFLLDRDISFEYHFITKNKERAGFSIRSTSRDRSDREWLSEKLIPDVAHAIQCEVWTPRPGRQCVSCYQRQSCGYRT